MILITCLVLNVVIVVFASVVVNLTPATRKYIVLYIYTTIVSLYDLIYPLGFLVSLKYQTLLSLVNSKKRPSSYIPIHDQSNNAPAPFSDLVSARSTTVPITAQYTGEFTVSESTH